jgi:hypothetical protein
MTGLDNMKKKQFLTLPVLDLRTLGRLACRQSLCRLRYPGSCVCMWNKSYYKLRKIAIYVFSCSLPDSSKTPSQSSHPVWGRYLWYAGLSELTNTSEAVVEEYTWLVEKPLRCTCPSIILSPVLVTNKRVLDCMNGFYLLLIHTTSNYT